MVTDIYWTFESLNIPYTYIVDAARVYAVE